jgi:hypothetical protein
MTARSGDHRGASAAIVVFAWLVFWTYAHPGFMTWDSVDQLLQARGAPITDWHPPIMAFTWRWLDRLMPGPALMLLVQSATLTFGVYSILGHMTSPRFAAIATALFLWFPPVFAPMGVIWKDSQMAGFLLFAIAAFLKRNRVWTAIGCLFALLATAERYNAAIVTAPLMLVLIEPREPQIRWQKYAALCALWLTITASAFAVNATLVERPRHPWSESIALHDISGVLARSPRYTDREITTELPGLPWHIHAHYQDFLRKHYLPYTWLNIGGNTDPAFSQVSTDAQRAISSAWRTIVSKQPIAYIQHRVRVFWSVLTIEEQPTVWASFGSEPWQADAVDVHPDPGPIQNALIHVALAAGGCRLLFEPVIYFVASIVLLLAFARKHRIVFALVSSGLLYELTLLPFAPSADYRYSHWLVVITVLSFILLVGRRGRPDAL